MTTYAQLCINNTYYTVCTSGLDEADVQVLSMNMGAQYGYLVQSDVIQGKFYPPITQTGIINISCPEGYHRFDPSYCSYQVLYDHCESNGGPALINCMFVCEINYTHKYTDLCTYSLINLWACTPYM